MKSRIRLSVISSAVLFFLAFLALGIFTGEWIYHFYSMKRLSMQQVRLQKELDELSKFRKWTEDYCRIYVALDIVSQKKISEEQKVALTEEVWKISRNYGFDPLLVPSIVFQESRGNPNAKGRFRSGVESGAYGLMQLKVVTAQRIGKRFGIRVETPEDLMRPEVNVVVGSAYLMRLIGRYGDLKRAIIAYNMGQGGVDAKIRENAPIPTFYYEGVLAKYRKLQQLVGERIGEISKDF